jgi:outer membrane protein OmpA-like peptidoglycan-associated protein
LCRSDPPEPVGASTPQSSERVFRGFSAGTSLAGLRESIAMTRHLITKTTRRVRFRSERSLAVLLALCAAACGGSIHFEDRIPVPGSRPSTPAPVPEPRVELRDDRIVINEKIQFAYDDDRILPASFGLLDEVGKVIKQNPQLKKIEIGGHASTEGSDEHNLHLSDRRAQAVMKHLVEQAGVEAERLAARGYGETRPVIHPDDTEEQREVNRRVEFLIVEQDAVERRAEADSTTGAETAAEPVAEPPGEGISP